MKPMTTEELLMDALYVDDYAERIAAAVDAGNHAEAGRLLCEATDKARNEERERDKMRDELAKGHAADMRELTAMLGGRLAVVPVREVR